ncbi:MAG TPA: adenosine deaminase [Actinophytocola sp.]|uniref:adenosine deaminase n=1 Tax=Actinophytocola sp. TaxID=1872138 RepID=UPI002DDCB401|nr:adenosine deaminase [Actinophytocola sp.]HEV2781051.1 adenosine deaminase [Actinophytocola sp.]
MTQRDLRALPKANLHLHLTGSMRPDTLAELAARYRVPVPPPLPAGGVHPWSAFQQRYDAARDAIRSAQDIRRVALEAVEDNLADGCGWVEIQVDPTSYAPRLGGVEPVLEAVLDAVSGVPAGVIVSSSWARSGAHAAELAALAGRFAGRGVVGFGLSNDERRGVVAEFAPAFRAAAEAGLLSAPHAGFYEAAWHVRECVETLGARRIGHGLTAAADPSTVALLAERAVALEVCPTSYPPFGVFDLAALPVRALLAAGVPVTLGSDDPLLFGAHVTDQYRIARASLGLSDAELAAIARHSVAASAAPAEVKRRLKDGISAWLQGR